ncbi:MAG: hypothetical protein KC636_22585, partial [Myxococcales bacterium]|nr:hypothetical protein [Myxococcales bacterium]
MVFAGAALSLSACGDDGGREASDSGTASATAVTATTDSASSDASGSESETTAGPDGTGSDSEGSTTAGTTVEPSTTTDETTETTDATTGVDPTTTATDSDTDSDTDTETTDDPCQGMGGGMLDFSYIWVANSAEGTVSKINTLNMIEEGRYVVRPDSAGNPSRTSVNLRGDVAVANRFGGVAKIAARVEDCVDLNANNTIDTSTGKFDVRPWGAEECLLWYTDFPQFSVMRPMAWTAGTFNEQTCGYENQLAWTT